ncbi:MAG: hypothetical protein SWH78_18015, partial [Thermodesulfobacteriota bacterium]|nr:hypothetical protein [Thermodesulfobacteriota bacterium]
KSMSGYKYLMQSPPGIYDEVLAEDLDSQFIIMIFRPKSTGGLSEVNVGQLYSAITSSLKWGHSLSCLFPRKTEPANARHVFSLHLPRFDLSSNVNISIAFLNWAMQ